MRRSTLRRTVNGASALCLAVAGTVALASPVAAASLPASTESELITAITTANGDAGTDTITLGANITLTASLPAITASVDIDGAGFSIDGGVGRFAVFTDTGAPAAIAISITGISITGTDSAVATAMSDLTLTHSHFDDAPVSVTGSGVIVDVSDSTFSNSPVFGFSADVTDSSQVGIAASTAETNTVHGFEITLNGASSLTMTASTSEGSIDSSGIDVDAHEASTVTITGSHANDNSNEGFDTDAYDGSTISISNSTASNNEDDGFDVDVQGTGSKVTLDGCTSSGNDSSGFDVIVAEGTITGTHLTASANEVYGLDAEAFDGSTITISDSSFLNTADGYGAGVEVDGASVTLQRIVASGSVTYDGGGVHIEDRDGDPSTVGIIDSMLSQNQGSGLDIRASNTTTTVERTTISGNDQEGGGGVYAGLEGAASLTVSNSTISGNHCGGGCGLYISTDQGDGASFTLANSTVFGNHGVYDGESGGVEIYGTPYTIRNSIVAGNSINGTPIDFLVVGDVPAVGTVNHSLVQTSIDAALTAVDAGAGNLKNLAAKLGPLANNGGLTLTHLPLAGSPVLGAGDPAFSAPPSTDQRGLARVVGVLDMGAVEVQAALAVTGAETTVPLAGSILLVAAGGLLLLVRRRRTAR